MVHRVVVPDQERELLGVVQELGPLHAESLARTLQRAFVDPSLADVGYGVEQRPLNRREVAIGLCLRDEIERAGRPETVGVDHPEVGGHRGRRAACRHRLAGHAVGSVQ